MHALVGPPPGAYTGPYPTLEESLKTLETGSVQTGAAIQRGRVTVNGKSFQLVGDQLNWWGYVVTQPDPAPIKAAVYKKSCVVVRVPRDLRPRLAAIYLFDATTGQCFAVYWDEGEIKS
jgi:hypothetical protein